MNREKRNKLLYLRNKILCVFDFERAKLKRQIGGLKRQNKKINDEIKKLVAEILELKGNTLFLEKENAMLKEYIRQKGWKDEN